MKVYFARDRQDPDDQRAEWLREDGYDVTIVAGPIDLGVELRKEPPDLVLLDVLIEGKNGFETARQLDLKFPTREFPVVLCSRIYRGNPFREEAQRCGTQDYVVLPLARREFLRRIKLAIAHFEPPRRSSAAA